MIYPARLAVPTAEQGLFRPAVIERAIEGALTVFDSPPGYLLTDSLAATLRAQGRSILWLRAEGGDRDPASFLISLLSAARRISPGLGSATLEEMQGKPGPIFGWAPLFSRLGQEMANELPHNTAIVLEDTQNLEFAHSTLQLFANHLLPVLPDSFTIILISDRKLPKAVFPSRTVIKGLRDLRLDPATGSKMARESGADLSQEWIQRAVQLTEGRAVALAGLCTACLTLGPAIIQQALKRSKNYFELFSQIAKVYFSWVDPGTLQALSTVAYLHYSHPKLVKDVLHGHPPLIGPWFQPLSDDWIRLRRFWRAPVQAVLGQKGNANKVFLRNIAAYLARNHATGAAIRSFLEIGDLAGASQVITESAETLLNTGQWLTLKEWLSLIHPQVLYNEPKLCFIRGELAAAEGQTQVALGDFAQAAALFSARQENSGACQSMLAEATLSSWFGDSARAQARCLSAKALAEASGLRKYKGWAEWQLGSLSAGEGKLDDALVYFGQAAADIEDAHLDDFFGSVMTKVIQRRDSQQRTTRYYKEFLNAKKVEQETSQKLHQLIGSPLENLEVLLKAWGWFNTPLAAKLPAPTIQNLDQDFEKGKSQVGDFWQKLLNKLIVSRKIEDPVMNAQHSDRDSAQLLQSTSGQFDDLEFPNPPQVTVLTAENLLLGDTALLAVSSLPTKLDYQTSRKAGRIPEVQTDDSLSISVNLLGKFRISVNNQPLKNLPSGKASAVIKYLLANHERRIPRDVLMDVFWPDAQPKSARNRLNVALHSLRQEFRSFTEVPVIIFDNGSYTLNPDVDLWIDVDDFERHVLSSRQLEASGELEAAMRELEIAASLYQGDFLEDDPYEDWAVLTRESTRLAYLDILDRLSHIYFNQGHYTACATLCQLILARDRCNEQASQLLMKCYSRQGQYNLAMRHYQICVEILREELSVDPDPATKELAERIQRRERV